MPSTPQSGGANFSYSEVRLDRTLLIVITCKECGAAKLASHFDGSLEKWQRDHKCEAEVPGG